jgi:branched-chain amino acid transport system substrate-binding protein
VPVRFESAVLLVAVCVAGAPALAADEKSITIVDVVELTGTGSAVTTGTNFENGARLAAKSINAEGGILGRKINLVTLDTQSTPGVAKALALRAVDLDAYAVVGPTASGSMLVSMSETRRAGIPNFTGAEAAQVTLQGNPFVFRTSFGQTVSMPKVARYLKDGLRADSVAVVWANNDFGKGGRDEMLKALKAEGIKVAADVSVEPQQLDFTPVVLTVRQSNADAVFVYINEEESARLLREFRKLSYDRPIVGETTLLGQKVIDLAGEAANGIRGHVGLTVDAPIPTIQAFNEKFQKEYGYRVDHNGMKGYLALYVIKVITERIGKFDRAAFAKAAKGAVLCVKDHPGVLLDVKFDDKGDIDRESFLVEVKNGRQEITKVLPPLDPTLKTRCAPR